MPYFTVGPLVNRSVALVTRDPALYAEIAGSLRERRLPSVSLLPGQRIPESAAVVLTSPAEAASIRHPRVLPVVDGGDRAALWAAVTQALCDDSSPAGIVVGIDPGPRPGYAIVAGRTLLGEGIAENPEAVGCLGRELSQRFGGSGLLFRVGNGDPPCRNRIVNGLLSDRARIELVNERGTTPRGLRRPRDMVAARRIALTAGRPIRDALSLAETRGAVSDVQRLSRLGSGGRVTIPRSAARRVLHGELSLAEAVADAMSRPRRAGGAAPAREPALGRQRI